MALSCKQKIDHSSFVNNSFKMKSYLESLSTVQARWKFKLLSHMTPLAMNFKREKLSVTTDGFPLVVRASNPPGVKTVSLIPPSPLQTKNQLLKQNSTFFIVGPILISEKERIYHGTRI